MKCRIQEEFAQILVHMLWCVMKNVSSRLEECVQRNGDHLEGITFRTLDMKSSHLWVTN
jgi:hypothetical protein